MSIAQYEHLKDLYKKFYDAHLYVKSDILNLSFVCSALSISPMYSLCILKLSITPLS